MYQLSDHFREQWKTRVGNATPSAILVNLMISNSLELQKFRKVYTPRGRSITVLVLYWNIENGLVFKVDEQAKKVVTVLTANMKPNKENLTNE